MTSNRRNRERRPARAEPSRRPRKRILVLCEGRNTEPQYLLGFKRWCRNPLVEVVVDPEHGVPLTLVRRAKEARLEAEQRAARERDDNVAYDEVWCVFDTDEHPNLEQACEMARGNSIEVALSNPCFELWLLLHFRDSPGIQGRKDVARSLSLEPRNLRGVVGHQAPMAPRRPWKVLAIVALLVAAAVALACPLLGPAKREPVFATQAPASATVPVDTLPPRVRRAFDVTAAFAPLPTPRPGDWLDVNEEELQTPADYLASEPNLPVAPRNVLYVLPVGALPTERGPGIDELTRYAHAFFGLEVRVLPTIEPIALHVTRRMHHGTLQLDASDILDHMEESVPDDAYCVIAVTWADLYPDPSYNFVFGLARLTARVGVFSFARLHPDFFGSYPGDAAETRQLVTRRALAVMSHEIGHMFGIGHCVSFACNMNGSNSLEESDRQPMHPCPVCLRKLHLALGFDPAARYAALEEQLRRAGLAEEQAWVQRQRAYLAEAAAGPG